MRSITFSILVAVLCAACQPDRNAEEGAQNNPGRAVSQNAGIDLSGPNSNFLVKLTSSMGAEASEPGDPVTGVVIAPVPLRGGRVEGTIDRADRSFLDFSFHTVHFEGKSLPIESEVTSVVSSKGNLGRDDLGQRIRVAGGEVIAYGNTTAIDEGAEVRFVGWEIGQ
jgi:hypothetical protein